MSLTIQTLKYQETPSALLVGAEHSYAFLSDTTIRRAAAKGTVQDIGITGTLLVASDCVLDSVDTDLSAKEVELNYYNLAFPVPNCDLDQTWLSAFANKYTQEEDVYIEALVPYLREQIRDEIRTLIHTQMIAEATTDTDVVKVSLAAQTIDTPANAYAAVLAFIAGLPTALTNRALDRYDRDFYKVEVSTEVYALVAQHLSDKVDNYGITIGGLLVVANKELSAKEMICNSSGNKLLFIDDTEDLTKIRIVEKAWLNTNYIITGVAFKASYLDSTKIVISN